MKRAVKTKSPNCTYRKTLKVLVIGFAWPLVSAGAAKGLICLGIIKLSKKSKTGNHSEKGFTYKFSSLSRKCKKGRKVQRKT